MAVRGHLQPALTVAVLVLVMTYDLGVCRFHPPVRVMLDSRQPPRAETNLGYLSASAVHSRSPTVRSTGVGAVQRANFDLRAGMLVSDRPDAVHRDPQATHDRALAWQCD